LIKTGLQDETVALLAFHAAQTGSWLPSIPFPMKLRTEVLTAFFLDFFTLEDGIYRMSQKSVTDCHCTLCKIPEERQYHLQHSWRLKSCWIQVGCEVQCTQARWQMDMKF